MGSRTAFAAWVRRFVTAAVAAVAVLLAAPGGAFADGEGRIVFSSPPRPVLAEGETIQVNQPVKFRWAASYVGDPEESWVGFEVRVDGCFFDNTGITGGGQREMDITFTYGGQRVVTVIAYHGFDDDGYRKTVTRRIGVNVGDPAPKKCAKPKFAHYGGTWRTEADKYDPWLAGVTFTLTEEVRPGAPNEVRGTLTYSGNLGQSDTLTFKGKVQGGSKRKGQETIVVIGTWSGGSPAAKPKAKKREFSLSLSTNEFDTKAYREITGFFQGFMEYTGRSEAPLAGFFKATPAQPLANPQARLCVLMSANTKKARPGDRVVFTVRVIDEGRAGFPAGRVGLVLRFENALVVQDDANPRAQRCAVTSKTIGDVQVVVGALGDGIGSASIQTYEARVSVAVDVDPAAGCDAVRCTAVLLDTGEESAATVAVDVGDERQIFVPVVGE